jgi:hypothetical protein
MTDKFGFPNRHWVKIGDDALGQHIDDIDGGHLAHKCATFLPREKLRMYKAFTNYAKLSLT